MDLNNQFIHFFDSHFGASRHTRCLLAVSGGVDSMVMLHLFQKAGINIGVAHCNFSLRGTESDQDSELVKQYCSQHHVEFHEKKFDTGSFAEAHKISIQVAARELRHNWFKEIAHEYSYDFVATAHHRDDQVETILHNVIRGAGLQGLSGIPIMNVHVIRPLLFATKEQLSSYAQENNIPFRNDASNLDPKYTRNRIRHELIPLLNSINSEAAAHIHSLGQYSQQAYKVLQQQVERFKREHLSFKDDQVHINTQQTPLDVLPFFIYETLKDYGFNSAQVAGILTSFQDDHTGRLFFSDSHKLIINRGNLIISNNQTPETTREFSQIITSKINQTIELSSKIFHLEFIPADQVTTFKQGHIYIDSDLLSLPFTFRKWQPGDRFKPLGLNGASKKISDFLIDEKVNLLDKEYVFVLENHSEIAAIVNFRTSEDYKITPSTKKVLHIYTIKQ